MINPTRKPNQELAPKEDSEDSPLTEIAEDRQRKQAALAVAVIVATSFIVVAWIIFLPFQLQKFSVLSDEERTRWNEVRNDVNKEETSLREALGGLRDSYDSLEGRLQEGSDTVSNGTGRVPQEVINRLREKLQEFEISESETEDVGTSAE